MRIRIAVLCRALAVAAFIFSFRAYASAGDYIKFDRMCQETRRNWDEIAAKESSPEAEKKRLEELELNLYVDPATLPVKPWEGKLYEQLEADNPVFDESNIRVSEEQERAIALRQANIQKIFSANELRKEIRRAEEERLYREQKEAELLEKRRQHVSTANFGHVYHREFHYRGEYRRADRLSQGQSIGEYYGGNWKRVSVEDVIARSMAGIVPHRNRRNQILYGQSSPDSFREQWERRHLLYTPDGRPFAGSARAVRP